MSFWKNLKYRARYIAHQFKHKNCFKNSEISYQDIFEKINNSEGLSKFERNLLKSEYPEIYYSALLSDKNWHTRYNYYCKTQPIVDNWVLYESHAGAGMLCNPLALFKAFQEREDFNNYKHFWVIADDHELDYLRNEYKDFKNVYFVKYNTVGYAYFVARCKYLINNTSFHSFFAKRDGQIFLNTWHSITVKYIGYDIPGGKKLVQNMLRNLLMADYIVSPNEFMTKIFNDSYRLREIYNGKYIQEGYPRNDLVIKTKREEIIKKLRDHGTTIDPNKKIILYAPTWSGNNVSNPKIDIERYTSMLEHFNQTIDTEKYQLIIKPHQIEYRNLSDKQLAACNFVSYNIDANSLLSIVDIVITDYSSIYFDYLVAKKPILFYIPDYKEYSKNRGIYFKLDELPGPCAHDLSDLSNYINNIEEIEQQYKKIADETRAWACKYDDANVSSRVLEVLFDNNQNHNLLQAPKSDKKKILFYPGTLATNGVTSAFLNLIKKIDYSKYDVTVYTLISKREDAVSNLDKLPDNVRLFQRVSAPILSKKEKKIYKRSLYRGYNMSEGKMNVAKRIMRREYVRTLADVNFDYIIDFSGYGTLFPLLATLGCEHENTKKCVWQHSDMYAEFSNEEKRKISKTKLTIENLVSVYDKFDKIVSASENVYKINKEYLATEETKHKFTYSSNLLDDSRFKNLDADSSYYIENDILYTTTVSKSNGFKKTTQFPILKDCIKFVTMGRCMPEKNQSNIIKALKRLNDEGINAALYIIGDGPLKSSLENEAANLGIGDKIIITEVMQNPFVLLKLCDCFIFPSYYEAQGLSVLEARMVGLPIIVSNFKAVKSVLIGDKQFLLKGFEAKDIYQGMKAYIDGKIPTDYVFDVDAYNQKGIDEFAKLLD